MGCSCYKIVQVGVDCVVDYTDCNGVPQSLNVVENTTNYLCARSINGTDCNSVVYNSPCFNGICLTGSSEILLYTLITESGPCPDICDGTIPLGGPEGTSEINIITGEPI